MTSTPEPRTAIVAPSLSSAPRWAAASTPRAHRSPPRYRGHSGRMPEAPPRRRRTATRLASRRSPPRAWRARLRPPSAREPGGDRREHRAAGDSGNRASRPARCRGRQRRPATAGHAPGSAGHPPGDTPAGRESGPPPPAGRCRAAGRRPRPWTTRPARAATASGPETAPARPHRRESPLPSSASSGSKNRTRYAKARWTCAAQRDVTIFGRRCRRDRSDTVAGQNRHHPGRRAGRLD